MGVQDSKVFSISCPQCNQHEEVTVRDKGSGWGDDNWQTPRSQHFAIVVTGGGAEAPDFSATCPECGVPSSVTATYRTDL